MDMIRIRLNSRMIPYTLKSMFIYKEYITKEVKLSDLLSLIHSNDVPCFSIINNIVIFRNDSYYIIYDSFKKDIIISRYSEIDKLKHELITVCLRSHYFKPKTLTILATSLCNKNCKYCYLKPWLNTINMNVREIINTINKLMDKMYVKQVFITGGEPLAEKEAIIELLNYLKHLHKGNTLRLGIGLLTRETSKLLSISKILKMYNTDIAITIELEDLLESHFTERIKLLYQTLKRPAHLLTVIHSKNIHYLNQLPKYLLNYKDYIRTITLIPISERPWCSSITKPQQREYAKCLSNFVNILMNIKLSRIIRVTPFLTLHTIFCPSLNGANIILTPTGKITWCIENLQNGIDIKDISNIWRLASLFASVNYDFALAHRKLNLSITQSFIPCLLDNMFLSNRLRQYIAIEFKIFLKYLLQYLGLKDLTISIEED